VINYKSRMKISVDVVLTKKIVINTNIRDEKYLFLDFVSFLTYNQMLMEMKDDSLKVNIEYFLTSEHKRKNIVEFSKLIEVDSLVKKGVKRYAKDRVNNIYRIEMIKKTEKLQPINNYISSFNKLIVVS